VPFSGAGLELLRVSREPDSKMACEQIQPLTPETRQLIGDRLADSGLSRAELARQAGVHKSMLTRMLNSKQPQRSISSRGLRDITRVLGILPELVIDQFELELEINEEFIEAVRGALTEELLRLKQNIGRVKASRITAVVGVEIHGNALEKQVFERVFALPTGRA
jgi:transcriptional regulator with XRE-family HTH domain